jgi:phosphoglycolate phosphatase-like HAD superfamily hydrolase
VRSIAVLGRFPTEKGLRAAHPEFLLDSLTDLPAILDRLRE